MKYYTGSYPKTPAMDRISYFVGGNCDAKIWNGNAYGANDSNNRFKAIHSNALNVNDGNQRSVYDPGFRVRSLKINHLSNQLCSSSSPNYDFGRCLPIINLNRNIFDSSHVDYRDNDTDGLDDEMEDILADAFRPIVVNHSLEDATEIDMYTTVDGDSVIEPVTAFQVRRSEYHSNAITVMYMKMWQKDVGTWDCPGHNGDTQSTPLHLMTMPGNDYGKIWWLYSTAGVPEDIINVTQSQNGEEIDVQRDGITYKSILEQEQEEIEELLAKNIVYDFFDNSDLEGQEVMSEMELTPSEKDSDKNTNTTLRAGAGNEFEWTQGSVAIRAPYFESLSGENIPMHTVIHLTRGKHHEYQDGGWSGQNDLTCTLPTVVARIDSRGELADPPLPKRPLNLRSPNGFGDYFNYNNVGSRDKYTGFMNNLSPFGFSGKNIWQDECFYSDDCKAPDRVFYCSNNINKACCLESNPDCIIKSSWTCH